MKLCPHEPRCMRLDATYCWDSGYPILIAAEPTLRPLITGSDLDDPATPRRGLYARAAEHLGLREPVTVERTALPPRSCPHDPLCSDRAPDECFLPWDIEYAAKHPEMDLGGSPSGMAARVAEWRAAHP